MGDNFIKMGFLDKLKQVVGLSDQLNSDFLSVIDSSIKDQLAVSDYFYGINFSEIKTYQQVVKGWEDSKKAEFIVFLCALIKKTINTESGWSWPPKDLPKYHRNLMSQEYLLAMFRFKLMISEQELVTIFNAFLENTSPENNRTLVTWPLAAYVKQVENNYLGKELPNSITQILKDIAKFTKAIGDKPSKDDLKLLEKIDAIVFHSTASEDAIKPTYFIGNDDFKDYANAILDKQKEEEKIAWYKLMAHAQKASGSKPSSKFLKDSKVLMDELGTDKFKSIVQEWFNHLAGMKETVTITVHEYSGQEYQSQQTTYLDSLNSDALKGFVWMSSFFHDQKTVQAIGKLAERCFKKIPGIGATAGALGNACLYTLYASKGLDGIAQLSKLKLKIKQNSTLELIEKYIDEAAKKLGISAMEIEDLAVDDFKLKEQKLTLKFGDFTCVLELIGIGKSQLRWYKKDGSEQKTIPQNVKDNFAEKLKKIKEKQKQIDQTTSTQKERLDRMLRSNRTMSMDYFREKYIQHPLLSFVIKNVIFNFTNNKLVHSALFVNGQWIDLEYNKLDLDSYTNVSLWHPVNCSTGEVKEWRKFLMDAEIQQPFKQAYREIYILTDAEINTRTYSNRMASHILKQHQYVTLAKGRNWKSRLIGAWDGGDSDTAELMLPEYKIKVEFWVNSLNADEEYNDTGIWNYVTTDQVRFVDLETREVLDLVDVPPVAFSEAMRDVDLFVGVASVGNDPSWNDSGGLPNYNNYWESYSFGDLSEVAKNRKEILQGLIPRLKIANVAHVDDKFVVVKGKLRTYKIHLGSTNILMEPNDQYLCIVPDRSKKSETEGLFLPFEGDNGLSVIISKAFLLANDDKITDTTITSQINRK